VAKTSRKPKRAKKVRVAMIGAGRMANSVHYPSLASFKDVEIAGVSDLDPQRLSETADQYGVKGRYADYRKMIEAEAPDAVYAIGPPQHMYDIWVWCLQQGLNLYIEKPMGITMHMARTLAAVAEEHQCITQVSFQRRACPMLVKLRDACLARGPMVHGVVEFYKCAMDPFLIAPGHMMDDGVHAIDTLRWICGGEVVEVDSHTRSIGVHDINFISAMLHFDTGATGLLVNSWTSGRRVFRVQMHAPGICAEGNPEAEGHLYADGDTEGTEFETRKVAGSDAIHVFGGFAAKNRDFIDAVKAGTQPESNFADAIKTMEVAETILAQGMDADV